jgi:hypothetical protein
MDVVQFLTYPVIFYNVWVLSLVCMIAQEWMVNLVEHFYFATHESDPLLHIFCSCFNYICPGVQGIFLQPRVGYCSNLSWLCLIIRAWVTLYRKIVVSLLLVISTILLFTYISSLYNADGVCLLWSCRSALWAFKQRTAYANIVYDRILCVCLVPMLQQAQVQLNMNSVKKICHCWSKTTLGLEGS